MTDLMKCTIAVLITICTLTATLSANWPEFRGTNGQGISTDANLPLKWSLTDNVTWKVKIKGEGWSSPVVYDGKVYLTAATVDHNKDPRTLRVVCVDAKSGTIDWDKKVISPRGKGVKHPKNSHSSSTLFIQDNRIYAHFAHMGTACLNLKGEILWKMNHFKYKPMHGTGSSPVLVGNNLIFNCDGEEKPFLAAVNKDTGNVVWKTYRTKTNGAENFSFCTPTVVKVGQNVQIVSPGSGAVWAYNPKDGKEIWRVYTGKGFSVTPRPVVGHGMVYVCGGFGNKGVYAIRPIGTGDVTNTHVAWHFPNDGPTSSTPLLLGQELYLVKDNGTTTCLDAITGKVHWQEKLIGDYSASPVTDGKKIVITREKGNITIIKAGKEFVKLAENDMKEKTYATPAIDGNALIIRTETTLYRIEDKTLPN